MVKVALDKPHSPYTAGQSRAAVADPAIVARYRMKTTRVPGSPCLWWTGAVSSRGHGRFWLGEVGGRDVVMIVHRFGWALEHGVAALGEAPVLGHRCDNPLCQRLGVVHVQLSSHTANRQEWAARRHALGNPLRDGRGSSPRFSAIWRASSSSSRAVHRGRRRRSSSARAASSLWSALPATAAASRQLAVRSIYMVDRTGGSVAASSSAAARRPGSYESYGR